ncbi:ABC transporter permease [Georgenia thermotolerans]|uniref:ABC transporter permease subunit n=1 Tax=Georgenia thermotolerans TaxID=527326 RepID=A0A7J5URU4_9MICO|nr:proline/glycine betaine ABC transporter permease [Georgenia thermotolerans]KAE8765069.1 ABC transporter permease subunit [Georgenia thermotolerans]
MNDVLFRIPVGEWADLLVDWLTMNVGRAFDIVRSILGWGYDALELVLSTPPFWVVGLVLAALAFLAKGWKLAVGSLIGFAVIYGVEQWDNAMATLALVLVASIVALVIAIPVGILAARNATVSKIVRPVLDFMQTMPAFVYLIPAVVLFRVGVVPGLVATVIFALAPGVRMTELGIRQVDGEVVEAGHAFGAAPGRILRQIQLPLALPTIMAGVNQVIMLALSMVVISGMVGAAGLGQDVVQALQRVDVALGFEAGLSVVILAMFLDRVTAALGDRAPVARALKIRAER